MIDFFPKPISLRGIIVYIISLLVVSFAFIHYAMDFIWIAFGIIGVLLFFLLSNQFSVQWQRSSSKSFVQKLFITALLLRIAWVIFSYFFYQYETGVPFEFDSADAIGYHSAAELMSELPWEVSLDYLFHVQRGGASDSGYVIYLIFLYKIFGPNIIIARLLKAVYGAYTCVLLYKLASRSMGEYVGRISGIFAALMPNLIIYCGMHLKETEMIFLMVAFLERADFVLRVKNYSWWQFIPPLLLASSLFLFRTVLGVIALFAFGTALVFSPNRVVKKSRKLATAAWVLVAVMVLAGGTIRTEVESVWEGKGSNQDIKRLEQTLRGNQWAQYATATVMAPMEFVMPFSTMVNTDQQNQMVLHGGNYVRNYMGVFILISLFVVLFVKKNWREFSLVGSFAIGYLGVISLSGFANSERFLLPGLPCLIIFWAYGVSLLNKKNYKFVKLWSIVVVLMEVGWAYFKIGSRGLLR